MLMIATAYARTSSVSSSPISGYSTLAVKGRLRETQPRTRKRATPWARNCTLPLPRLALCTRTTVPTFRNASGVAASGEGASASTSPSSLWGVSSTRSTVFSHASSW